MNEREDAFIRQRHSEVGLPEMADLRKLGCPDRIYNKLIEQRAAKIAGKLQEFRAAHRTATPETDLQTQILGGKLF